MARTFSGRAYGARPTRWPCSVSRSSQSTGRLPGSPTTCPRSAKIGLLTLLVVDAYTELAEVVGRAEAAEPRGDHLARWRALAHAVRDWALAEPSRYALLFGTPVPGYAAPAEQTTAPGTAIIVLLMRLVADAEAAGSVAAQGDRPPPDALRADVERVRADFGVPVSDAMLVAAVLAWVGLFGAVSFEVFGQYGPATFTEPVQVFDALVDLLAHPLGLGGPAEPVNPGPPRGRAPTRRRR